MWVPPKTFQCFLLVQSDDIFPSNSAQMLQSFRTLNRSSGRSPHRWPHFKTTPLRQRTFWMLPFQKPGIFSLRPSHIGTVFFWKIEIESFGDCGGFERRSTLRKFWNLSNQKGQPKEHFVVERSEVRSPFVEWYLQVVFNHDFFDKRKKPKCFSIGTCVSEVQIHLVRSREWKQFAS